MIVAGLMNVLLSVLDLLLVFKLPSLPDGVMDFLALGMEAIGTGFAILNNYVDIGYIFALFGSIVLMEGAYFTYKFVMWVVRKIPMAGVS